MRILQMCDPCHEQLAHCMRLELGVAPKGAPHIGQCEACGRKGGIKFYQQRPRNSKYLEIKDGMPRALTIKEVWVDEYKTD